MISTKQKNKVKLPEVSCINVLLCLFVIFIHVSSTPVSTLNRGSFAYLAVFTPWRLAAFAVQGFIFLSGLKLYLNGGKRNYKNFFLKRFTKILIPYLIWNVIYYVYFVSIGYFPFNITELLTYILNGTLVGHFYFIIIILQFYLLVPLFDFLIKRIDSTLLIIMSLIITVISSRFLPDIIALIFPDYNFIYNDRVFSTYLIYFVLGILVGTHLEKAKEAAKKSFTALLVSFIISLTLNLVLSYLSFTGIKYIPYLEYFHFLYCVTAVLFVYSLFVKLTDKREIKNRFLKAVDNSSFYIYLCHCLFIFITDRVMSTLGIHDTSLTYPIRIVFVYTVSISLSIVYSIVKNKIKSKLIKKSDFQQNS